MIYPLSYSLQKTGATSSADWVLNPAEFEAAFSPQTKIFILNTPNNPLGKVMSYAMIVQTAGYYFVEKRK